MSRRNPVPDALNSYLHLPPEASLIVLTSVLGCSINWLSARYVYAAFQDHRSGANTDDETAVVLVSWLRDCAFWQDEVRRAAGLDLARKKTFSFVDGLSGLFSGNKTKARANLVESTTLRSSSLREAEEAVMTLVRGRSAGSTMLILDAPDVLLATTETGSNELSAFVLRLRSQVHATLLVCSADAPLMSAAAPDSCNATRLEASHASFVMQQSHAAHWILSARELDTGAAKDVSGVLRVTKGGSYDDELVESDAEECEVLYHALRDGNVKVFQRGSGMQ